MGDIERIDLGEVPYEDAIREMSDWVARRRAGEIGDRLVLLGHPPVITYGSRTPLAERERGPADLVRQVENGLIRACAALGFETVRRTRRRVRSRWSGSGRPSAGSSCRSGCGSAAGSPATASPNVTSDLEEFRRFTACGLPGVPMTPGTGAKTG